MRDYFVIGGDDGPGTVNNTAEYYDPASDQFILAGVMTTERNRHATTAFMPPGRFLRPVTALVSPLLLVSGGYRGSTIAILDTAELYEAWSGAFEQLVARMSSPRANHTSSILPDNRILLAGGETGQGAMTASAELFDPATADFTVTGSMSGSRAYHRGTSLRDGRVLITGGVSQESAVQAATEVFDPQLGSFAPSASMNVARWQHAQTLLKDGKVLVSGGLEFGDHGYLASAEIYDPISNSFAPVGNMVNPHVRHAMTLLDDGRVLVSGTEGAEIYDPVAQSFESIGSGTGNHAVLMQDGKVLMVAESNASAVVPKPSASVFDPRTNTIRVLGAKLAHSRLWFTLTAVSPSPGLRQWMRIDPLAVLLSPQIYSDLNRPDPPPFAELLQAARPVIEQLSSGERKLAMKQLRQVAELLRHFEKELSRGQ